MLYLVVQLTLAKDTFSVYYHLTVFTAQSTAWLCTPCLTCLYRYRDAEAPSDVDLRDERVSSNYGSSHQPQASAFILKGISTLNIISLNYGAGIFIVEATRRRNVASG